MDWGEIFKLAAGASLPAGLLTQAIKIGLRRYERRLGAWWDWVLRAGSAILGALTIILVITFGWLQTPDQAIAVLAGFGGGLFATAFHATLRRLIRTFTPATTTPAPTDDPPVGE